MASVPYSNRVNKPNSTRGGMGSFSYADTKVYGLGGDPAFWLQQIWKVNNATGEVTDSGKKIWLPPGEITFSTRLVPGQGGGAKLPGKRLNGGGSLDPSASTNLGGTGPGPNPNGIVLIRLMKID
jgi:hypothetical protein